MKQPNAAQVLQQIAHIQHMEPGKLCVIGQGPNGPYYNLQCREQGKAVSRYVPGDQVELVAQHTANYQEFQALVTQYAQLIIEQTRAERTAGFKKRPRAGESCEHTGSQDVAGADCGGPKAGTQFQAAGGALLRGRPLRHRSMWRQPGRRAGRCRGLRNLETSRDFCGFVVTFSCSLTPQESGKRQYY